MNRYPNYKGSSIDWIGSVPSHWDAVSVKRIANVVNGATPKSTQDEYWGGDIVWITPADLGKLEGIVVASSERKLTETGVNSCGTSVTPAGSVVLSTRAPIGHVALTATPSCTNQGCKTLVPNFGSTDAKFLYYTVLAGKAFLQALGQGSTFTELPTQALADVLLPLPPLDEQRQLAAYLDRKTGEIDTLIRKKQDLIALLREQRNAVINRAITRGLDPDTTLKDSGVERIGQIPAKWEVKRVGYLCDMLTGFAFPSAEFAFEPRADSVPLVRGDNVTRGHLRWGTRSRHWTDVEPYRRFLLDAGDVVVGMDGSRVGDNYALITKEDLPLMLVQRVMRLRPHSVDSRLLYYNIGASFFKEYVTTVKSDPAIPHISPKNIHDFKIALPPEEEQADLVEYVHSKATEFDRLVDNETKLIKLLQELRTSLISEVVTGKIDVRGEVPASDATPVEEVAA